MASQFFLRLNQSVMVILIPLLEIFVKQYQMPHQQLDPARVFAKV